LWTVGIAVVVASGTFIAFQVTPWPSALLIRYAFTKDAARVSQALERHVPAGGAARLNERYDPNDSDAYLDIFYPSKVEDSRPTPLTVVWVHGGGWVSGSKDQIANYARILAARGFTVVGVNYTTAPAASYPTPVRQINVALSYLAGNAARLHLDPSGFVLAGDSAGAQIAAQVANIVVVPSYAQAMGIAPSLEPPQLVGVVLYCGAYTLRGINLDGRFGGFLKTVLWSYSGSKNFMTEQRFATASVVDYVTAQFPPTYISDGNADPLLPQSVAFADALASRGVRVERLFFPHDYKPPLLHEYQFDLDTEAGRLALERSTHFLSSLR